MTTTGMTGFELAVAVATASPRGHHSQDRGVALSGPEDGAVVVVCDGVGSCARSGEVAGQACVLAAAHLREGGAAGIAELPAVVAATLPDEGIGATTLLALAADRSGELGYCLVGNGMVVEAHALRIDEERVQMSWTELALPQISLLVGKPTLASHLPWTGLGAPPSCIGGRRLEPDRTRLYMACTDGIGSSEERPVGSAPDGTLWRQVDPPLAAVLGAIGEQWHLLEACAEPAAELERILGAALERLLDDGSLEDDATVGAVLVRPATAVGAAT